LKTLWLLFQQRPFKTDSLSRPAPLEREGFPPSPKEQGREKQGNGVLFKRQASKVEVEKKRARKELLLFVNIIDIIVFITINNFYFIAGVAQW
jgi:hypothetical protein